MTDNDFIKGLVVGMLILFLVALSIAAHYKSLKPVSPPELSAKLPDVAAYNRGFADGMKAVEETIKYDTNTGHFLIEMTNVLPYIKP